LNKYPPLPHVVGERVGVRGLTFENPHPNPPPQAGEGTKNDINKRRKKT